MTTKYNDLKIDELPKRYREMSQIIGIENTVKLALHYGGLPFYFLKIDSLPQKRRDRKIRTEFNGRNYKDLARKYKLSEMHIRRIVKKNRSVTW
jgi:Mor family transcriptional regulator